MFLFRASTAKFLKPATVPANLPPATRVQDLTTLGHGLTSLHEELSVGPLNREMYESVRRSINDGVGSLGLAAAQARSLLEQRGAKPAEISAQVAPLETAAGTLTGIREELVALEGEKLRGRRGLQFTVPESTRSKLARAVDEVQAAEAGAAAVSGPLRDEFSTTAPMTPFHEVPESELPKLYRTALEKKRFAFLQAMEKTAPALAKLLAGDVEIIGLENLPENPGILSFTHGRMVEDGAIAVPLVTAHLKQLNRTTMVSGAGPKLVARAMDAVVSKLGMLGVHIGGKDGDGYVQTAATLLRRGQTLSIFGEGRMNLSRSTGRIYPGTARVALLSGASVTPVAISGQKPVSRILARVGKRSNLVLSIGPPIQAPEGTPLSRHNESVLTDRIGRALSHELLEVSEPRWRERAAELPSVRR